MSIAWATVALLILLLPGVLFSVGLFLPHNVAREAVPRSPLGELASGVLIAFTIHGVLFIWLGERVNVAALLALLQLHGADAIKLDQLAAILLSSRARIVLYVLSTCAAGLFMGVSLGWLISKGRFRALVQHGWVLDLTARRKNGHVLAYVMTHVRHEQRILMYRGYLQQFGLQKDGSFAYLALSEPTRYYMLLESAQPITSDPDLWRPIGIVGTTPRGMEGAQRTRTVLVVEGEDIQNVVFEWFDYTWSGKIGSIRVLLDDEAMGRMFGISPDDLVFKTTDSPESES